MHRPASLLAAAAWLAAMSASCSTTVVHTEIRNTRSAYGLLDHTEELVVPLRVPEDARSLSLDLEVDGEAGRVTTELVSPSGRVPWRQSVDRGGFTQALAIPADDGEWRCRLVFEGFSGSYSVALSAVAGPELDWVIDSIEVQTARDAEPSSS